MADVEQVVARPTGDRVLIKVIEPQVGSLNPHGQGGLFMFVGVGPQQEPERPELAPARGIIVAVGPGYVVQGVDERHYVRLDVKPGDEVLFFEDRGLKLKINDEELYLLNEQFILVVLDSMDGRPAEVYEDDQEGAP